MSCETLPICRNNKTYYAHIQLRPTGDFLSGYYLDENLQRVDLTAGTFEFGSCAGAGSSGPENESIISATVPTVPPADPAEVHVAWHPTGGYPVAVWNPTSSTWAASPPAGPENEVIISATVPVGAPSQPQENKSVFDPTTGRLVAVWNAGTGTWITVSPRDVTKITQALVVGANVITHNLNSTDVEVELRNTSNGAEIAHRVTARTANNFTINVGAAFASVDIFVDA
jgi:hypothetical protein